MCTDVFVDPTKVSPFRKVGRSYFGLPSMLEYDLDLLPACANPALDKGLSNFGYLGKNGG
ncbi:hypothetical protein CHH60_27055 [Paenibacillus sp. 7523-1]|nr:hypothetical protein CHH60_27055 [Paenibacillus sp. 7523-1]